MTNDPSPSAAPPARAALYCARLASAAVEARLGLLLGRSRLVQTLFRRRACGRQPLGACAIACRQSQRRLGVGACPLKLRQIRRHRRRRHQAGELLTARDARAERHLDDARQSAVDRRDHVCGAARSGVETRRHADRFANRLFFHQRGREVQAPLLFLQETDAWRIVAPAGAAARAAPTFGCTSTSPTRCSSFNPVASAR